MAWRARVWLHADGSIVRGGDFERGLGWQTFAAVPVVGSIVPIDGGFYEVTEVDAYDVFVAAVS